MFVQGLVSGRVERFNRSMDDRPQGPLPIRRLEEALVNRIAAGEVCTPPAPQLL